MKKAKYESIKTKFKYESFYHQKVDEVEFDGEKYGLDGKVSAETKKDN